MIKLSSDLVEYVKDNVDTLDWNDCDVIKRAFENAKRNHSKDENISDYIYIVGRSVLSCTKLIEVPNKWENVMSEFSRESPEYKLITTLLAGLIGKMDEGQIQGILELTLCELSFHSSSIWKAFSKKAFRLERMKRRTEPPKRGRRTANPPRR
ncbi:MAG: hypothetical protein PHS95_02835 [Candidatus Pacebacteria bacterium]|nr:hypothetical protein [Candidatus Paceibacterota bacterium]